MAHWAKLDDNNIVTDVTIGSNEDLDEGYQWLIDNLGGRWVKTSYNTFHNAHKLGGIPLRGNYASIGYTYNEALDVFIPPQPNPEWVLDTTIFDWVAPEGWSDAIRNI
jgi:hypothetical protein